MTITHRLTCRQLRSGCTAVVAMLLLALAPAMAAVPPDGVSADEWREVETALRAEAGLPPAASHAMQEGAPRGGLANAHGLVRTHVLSGDYTDMPAQSSTGPEFGYSIASDGDWLAVGAPGTVWTHNVHGTASHGVVFVFHNDNGSWNLHQRIQMTNSPAGPRCGHAVALKMPYLAFGCPDTDNFSGTQTPGWTRVWRQGEAMGQFEPSSSHPGSSDGRCGTTLAMTRNYLAVGCPTALRSSDNIETGGVVIYRRNPLTGVFASEESLEPAGSFTGARFGHAVAMYESSSPGFPPLTVRLAIGTPNRVYAGDVWPSGAVYLYSRPLETANWSLTTGFTLADASAHTLSGFGSALAMNRAQLVVGAPNNAVGGSGVPGPGTVHRFQLNELFGWTAMESGNAVNLPDGLHAGMRFGGAVAIGFDNFVAVAAPHTDGETDGGGVADAVGLVEVRRSGDEGYSVNGYRGEMRPAPLGVLSLAEGHFGHSVEFDTAARRMLVGYPRLGTSIIGGGRRGSVWLYQTDALFADGFQ